MRIVDYDMLGAPIYDPLDLMARAALLPVFYATSVDPLLPPSADRLGSMTRVAEPYLYS
jgi:hypothetical protein